MSELLPCPFCGKDEPHFHPYSRKIGFDVFCCIRCYCGAEVSDYTEDGAKKSWNTRVATSIQLTDMDPAQRLALARGER